MRDDHARGGERQREPEGCLKPATEQAPPAEAVPVEAPAAQEPVTEVHQIVEPPVAPAPVPGPVAAPQLPVAPDVPEARPRLRDRILDKIPGLRRLGDGN